MYRITWHTSKNPLGETHSRDEERKENVILWIMANHDTLTRLSSGYSVHWVDKETGQEIICWNWQEDKSKCFGKLFKEGFLRMVQLVDGELRVYRDVLSLFHEEPFALEPDEFSGLIATV